MPQVKLLYCTVERQLAVVCGIDPCPCNTMLLTFSQGARENACYKQNSNNLTCTIYTITRTHAV